MYKYLITTALILAGMQAVPVHAAPGDILIKLKGGYALRSGSSDTPVTIASRQVTIKEQNNAAVQGSISVFLSNHIAAEFEFGGNNYTLKDSAGRKLLSAGSIMPTALLQYYLMPASKRVHPYIGVGIAYQHFYSEKPGEILSKPNAAPATSYSVSLKSRIVPVARIGADVFLDDQMFVLLEGTYAFGKSSVAIEQGANIPSIDYKTRNLSLSTGVGFRF